MSLYKVKNEAVLIPALITEAEGTVAGPNEVGEKDELYLDRHGRPAVQYVGVDRGDFIYTESGDLDSLEDGENATFAYKASSVKKLLRKGAIEEVDRSSASASSAEEDAAADEAADNNEGSDTTNAGSGGGRKRKGAGSKS